MYKKLVVVLMILVVTAFTVLPAMAQDAFAEDLVNPRGIAFDSNGDLYIVEAGNGGDLEVEGGRGPIAVGGTGRVLRVTPDGDTFTIVQNLASMTVGNSRGAQDIIVTEDSYWLLLGQTPLSLPFSNALVELDRETTRVKTYVDLYTIEAEENPDGDIVESNPTGFAVGEDGTVYISNASCNCLQSWSADNGLEIAVSWTIDDNPVPTAIAVGPDGDVYVGMLTGFPFPEGGSRIERWSGGELAQTYEGLTAVVDILVTDDGTIYATEFGVFGDSGFAPGRVVMVSDDGVTPVMEELTSPWGLAQDGDGNLFVVVSASGGSGGAVLPIPMGG